MDRVFIYSLIICILKVALGASLVTIQPEAQTVRIGDMVKILCKAQTPIMYCRFSVNGLGPLNLHPSNPAHRGVQYFGNGYDQGECGIQISQVSDVNNGQVSCSFGIANQAVESSASMKLTVAMAPPAPMLEVKPGKWSQGAYKEDETLQASCKVARSRPVSSITWFIDGEQISSGLSAVQYIDEPNDLKTTMQNLSMRLRYTDNGKNLRCVASHIAQGPGSINQTLFKLNVLFPPKPSSQEYERFGFTVGSPGEIKVTVHANPRPEFVWQIGNEYLKDNNVDHTGRLKADHTYRQSERIWEAILRIMKVTDEEVDKRYILTATNEFGKESYNVAISTSPAPPIVTEDITTGAIVGIIIAVLVIILLLFMIIFARATGRWCFAAGPNENKTSSETAIGDGADDKRPPSVQGKDGVYASSEYINGNDKKKSSTDKINTPV